MDMFTGENCETEKPCEILDMCMNGGTCMNSADFSSSSCDCVGWWTGDFCQTEIALARMAYG